MILLLFIKYFFGTFFIHVCYSIPILPHPSMNVRAGLHSLYCQHMDPIRPKDVIFLHPWAFAWPSCDSSSLTVHCRRHCWMRLAWRRPVLWSPFPSHQTKTSGRVCSKGRMATMHDSAMIFRASTLWSSHSGELTAGIQTQKLRKGIIDLDIWAICHRDYETEDHMIRNCPFGPLSAQSCELKLLPSLTQPLSLDRSIRITSSRSSGLTSE